MARIKTNEITTIENWEDKTVEQIADIIGRSVAQVNEAVNRIKNRSLNHTKPVITSCNKTKYVSWVNKDTLKREFDVASLDLMKTLLEDSKVDKESVILLDI